MRATVLIAGTYVRSDAYPNVKYRLELMHAAEDLHVIERHRPLVLGLDYSTRLTLLRSIAAALVRLPRVTGGALLDIVRGRRADVLYLPYPAVHILWLLSLLPRRVAPRRIVADVIISLHDTVVGDRRLLSPTTLAARALLAIERRAFGHADALLTDTPENGDFYASVFGVDRSRFVDVPLSIDSDTFHPPAEPYRRTDRLDVLFVGTLVPLHGSRLLCEALERLPPDLPLRATIVGNGQEADVVDEFMARFAKRDTDVGVEWVREWQESSALAERIRSADLCLGVFGNAGKSQRVWPFKNYLYLACGRPLVTAASPVAERLLASASGTPFLTVDTRDARGLARVLTRIARDRRVLEPMSVDARACYARLLSPAAIRERLRAALVPSPGS